MLRLANHLRQVYRGLTDTERHDLLEVAKKCQPLQSVRGLAGQEKMEAFLSREVAIVQSGDDKSSDYTDLRRALEVNRAQQADENSFLPKTMSENCIGQKQKRASMAAQGEKGLDKMHPLSNSTLADIRRHLTARMGANLEDSTADQHIRNVAKVLYYINAKRVKLMDLYQTNRTSDYLDALDNCGVGGYGQRARVDACVQALAYLQTEDDNVNISDVDRALAKLTMFKRRLRKEETVQERLRREEEGRLTVEAKEIDSILDNDDAVVIWALEIVHDCDSGRTISEQDILFAMRYLLVSVTLDKGQRPGPAINMTVREFDERKFASDGSAIIYVAKHKDGGSRKCPVEDYIKSHLGVNDLEKPHQEGGSHH